MVQLKGQPPHQGPPGNYRLLLILPCTISVIIVHAETNASGAVPGVSRDFRPRDLPAGSPEERVLNGGFKDLGGSIRGSFFRRPPLKGLMALAMMSAAQELQ